MKGKDGGAAKVLRREWALRRLPRWGRGVRRRAAPFAPKRLFKPFRCSAWLIFREEHIVLFTPKRSCSRFAALTLRVSSHRNAPSGHSGVPVGLFYAKSTQYSLLQNARPSGSLRSPYG